MPYASKAQHGYMHAAADRGEIKKSTVAEYDKASKGKTLPERIKRAKKKKAPKKT